MEDGDSVTKHLNAFNTLVSQLIYVDIKLEEEDKCITLLCSLPDSWDNLVVAIGSTNQQSALKFEDVVASLLSEEMRRKSMGEHNMDALMVRGHSKERRNKFTGGRSKSRGRSKSLGDPLKKVCWKCGKPGNFKKNCRSRSVERGKGIDDTTSMEGKSSLEEGGDVYLASTSTQSKSEVWFIDSSASFHMTPHREWFCEYERCDGDVFLGDDWPTKIIGCGRVKLQLKDGRVRTLPWGFTHSISGQEPDICG
jgi:hypothetical protein